MESIRELPSGRKCAGRCVFTILLALSVLSLLSVAFFDVTAIPVQYSWLPLIIVGVLGGVTFKMERGNFYHLPLRIFTLSLFLWIVAQGAGIWINHFTGDAENQNITGTIEQIYPADHATGGMIVLKHRGERIAWEVSELKDLKMGNPYTIEAKRGGLGYYYQNRF